MTHEEEKNELDVKVVWALVTRLETSPSTITYEELSMRIKKHFGGDLLPPWRTYDAPLGRIQEACNELGLPCLPVMAVTKTGMKPGTGFVSFYRTLHPESENLTDAEIADLEWRNVRACKEWQRLLDHYAINHRFRGTKDAWAERAANLAFEEGKRQAVHIKNEITRNPEARKRCLEIKGTRCRVCDFDSNEKYGISGIIQVHHLHPLAESAGTRVTDPERDLVPVCPNCHALIHSKPTTGGSSCYSIEEAKAMYEKAQAEKRSAT